MTHKTKLIRIPLCDPIEVGHLLPIIDSRPFQALREKKQLGMTYLVFDDGDHSRFEHSLGAYRATRTLCHVLVRNDVITEVQLEELCAYALLHDVGHPAFSHVTEDFCRVDDDERSAELIDGPLRGAIAACGINPDAVLALARKEDPLYQIVHDRNLGIEKLDYLERDGFHTGLDCPSGIRMLRKYLLYIDGQVAVDEKGVENVLDVLAFYMKMYKEVYFRKALVIAQRMFQRAVYRLICTEELDPETLLNLTDPELWGGYLYRSKELLVRETYTRIRNRRLFKEAIVYRPQGLAHETRISEKPITALDVSPLTMDVLSSIGKKDHSRLDSMEFAIAKEVGLSPNEVLVVPEFNPERFVPADVNVYTSRGIESLRAWRPAFYRRLEETAQCYKAFRVCTSEENREQLSRAAKPVLEVIEEIATTRR